MRVVLTLTLTLINACVFLGGCQSRTEDASGHLPGLLTLEIAIVGDEEHLGHDIDESGGHSVWCDGVRARILPSNDVLMVYSCNPLISNSTFQFENGHRYQVRYSGQLGLGVMAYVGKSLDLAQIRGVVELENSATR